MRAAVHDCSDAPACGEAGGRRMSRVLSTAGRGLSAVAHVLSTALIALIRVYQYTLSPLLGQRCKFYPSCSNYAIDALREHGAARGLGLAAWRILRCNPFSNGGYDPVPPMNGCGHDHGGQARAHV